MLTVAGTGAEPDLDWTRDPAAVVASYRQQLGEIGERDSGPSVTIYGDGRVDIHFPVYMKRAGDYRLWLGTRELEEVLGSIVASGFLELDPEAAAAERAARPAGLVAAPGATTTVMEVRLEDHGGPARERRPVEKRVAWRGLRGDARRFPDLAAVRTLAAVERVFRALMERDDLRRLD